MTNHIRLQRRRDWQRADVIQKVFDLLPNLLPDGH
jgi:hypothetical protein